MYYYTVINIIICSHVSTILPELRSYMYITLYCAKLYIHTLFYHTGVIFYFKLYHTYYSINVFFIELYMITKYRYIILFYQSYYRTGIGILYIRVWRHALRSEWPFIIIIIFGLGVKVNCTPLLRMTPPTHIHIQ